MTGKDWLSIAEQHPWRDDDTRREVRNKAAGDLMTEMKRRREEAQAAPRQANKRMKELRLTLHKRLQFLNQKKPGPPLPIKVEGEKEYVVEEIRG